MTDAPEELPGRELSGWLLRGVLLCVSLMAVALAVQGETSSRLGTVSVVGTVVVLVGTVLLPASLAPGVLIAVLALTVLDRDPAPLAVLVSMAALAHAIHLLAGLCALGPPSTRYRVAGLVPTARRWAVAQAAALPVVVVAWWAAGAASRGAGVGDRVEVGAGVAALLLLAGLVVLARRRMR